MNRIRNLTAYPTKTIERLVHAELDNAGVTGVTVEIVYNRGGGYTTGLWEWRGWRHMITIRMPRRGIRIQPYHPYARQREMGRDFALLDWKEALVAVAAHEAEHARQFQVLGETRGRRGSGRRRSQVEVRCDLAAYRAVMAYRKRRGKVAA